MTEMKGGRASPGQIEIEITGKMPVPLRAGAARTGECGADQGPALRGKESGGSFQGVIPVSVEFLTQIHGQDARATSEPAF